MSKKILSIVLAVVMLFSICAIAANAAVAEGKSIGIKVVTDATTNTKKGDTVKVKVYFTVPDESQEYLLQNGPIAVAWNSAAYAPKTTSTNKTITDCREWGASYVNIMKTTTTVTTSPSDTIISTHKANATDDYGWDSACRVIVTMNGENGYTTTTGFPIDPDCEFFTMSFIAQKDITADDVIGIPYGTYGDANLKIQAFDGTSKPALYPAETVDFSEAVPAPATPAAPSYDVYNLKGYDKIKPADKHSNGDGTNTVAVYFGLGMDPVVNKDTGKTTFITAITATVTVKSNGETVTVNTAELDKNGEIKYVYKVGEGYGFRVILQNVPDGADVTVTPAIVSTDINAAYNIETVSFNVADAYARS